MALVLITGASSGIGEACARVFAAQKGGLFLVARRGDRLARMKEDLEKQYEVEVQTAVLDVSKRAAVEAWAEKHAAVLARVECLINNAGLARGLASLQEGDPSDWDDMIDTNLKGLLYVTRAVLPGMVARGSGHIVNLGSVAGRWTYPKGNIYSATKYAVRSLTESLRLDLNGTGVRVTEIAPGMVETEFSQVRLGDAAKARAVYAGMTPLKAEDIAESVLWCVQRPRHVNVQELVIYPTDQASVGVVSRRGLGEL